MTLAAPPAPPLAARTHRAGPPVAPLAAAAVGVVLLFTAVALTTPGRSLNVGPVSLPADSAGIVVALALVTLLGLDAVLSRRVRTDPAEVAVALHLAVLVALPFAHLEHDRATSYAVVVSLAALTAAAVHRRPAGPLPVGWPLVAGLVAVLAVSSAVSPDAGALKQLVVAAAAALPPYLLAARPGGVRPSAVAGVVVALAAVESALAVVEPVLFPRHLFAAAQLDAAGDPSPLVNTLLDGVERSQGTLGHPLPLGLLLVLALALLVRRVADVPGSARALLVVVLLAGLVATGDRNALLTAVGVLVCGTALTAGRALAGVGVVALGVGLLVDVGVLTTAPVRELLESGSFLHRADAYRLVWRLASGQAPWQALFGNGFASTPRMFAAGRLQQDALHVVDNQFVLVQSQGGLVCLLLLVALVLGALLAAPRPLRVAVGCAVVVLLIFDVLLWPGATALCVVVLSLAVQRAAADRPAVPA